MRSDDLAPFAVADGLLARIAERPSGMSDQERQYLLDRARETLAKATGETLENAGRALFKAADEGEFVIRCSEQFATVAIYGRLLVVFARVELRGACHPNAN